MASSIEIAYDIPWEEEMTKINEPEYRAFVQSVIDNIKKNGFPEKRVAFPLEKMYEIAYEKGFNFNKVLATLKEIKIDHKKTEEKIIFFPENEELKKTAPKPAENPRPANPMDAFANMGDLNPDMFKNMNMTDMMSAASSMMKNMKPDQINAMKDMYENLSEEEKKEIMDKAKGLGIF